jgi:ribose 5-phosphate isomerase B
MRIALGSDHAGFRYKELLKAQLLRLRHEVHDYGTHSTEPVDYPIFIRPVAEAVARGDWERGIVLGGSGNGEAIVANKVRGVRCALCWDITTARLAREHNDANVLALGARLVGSEVARDCLLTFLATAFAGGRHARRVAKLSQVTEPEAMSDRSPEVAL